MKSRQLRLPRSYLFVPGNRPDRFDRALASGADMVVLDLEDSVAPDQKNNARQAVLSWLSPEHPVCLRINGMNSGWFDDDLKICTAAGVAAIMLPKVESQDPVERVTDDLGEGIPVLPFIESASGYWNMLAVAGARGVQRLVFGALDFLLDLGMSAQADELNSVRLQMVLISRLAGIAAPVESVTQDIDDTGTLRDDARRARSLGFGGKLCIHPSQVTEINNCFSYSAEELAWARKVMAAAEQSNGAVKLLEGKMIDKPVIERARLILGQSGE